MRLVRVATDNPNSKFDGILQDDLTLPPDARIALQSLSLEQEEGTLDLRSENASRTFSYSIDGNNFQGNPTSIAPKLYAYADQKELLHGCRESLNRSLIYSPFGSDANFTSATQGGIQQLMLGASWDAYVANDGKAQFVYTKGSTAPHEDLLEEGPKGGINEDDEAVDDVSVQDQVLNNGNTVRKWSMGSPDAPNDAPPQVLACATPLSQGSGYFECCINPGSYNPDAPANLYKFRGVMLGLSKTNLANVTAKELAESFRGPVGERGRSKYVDWGMVCEFENGTDASQIYIVGKKENGTHYGYDAVYETILANNIEDDQGNVRLRMQMSNGLIFRQYYKGQGEDPLDRSSYNQVVIAGAGIQTLDDGAQVYPFVVFFSNDQFLEISELQLCLSTEEPSDLEVEFTPADGWDRNLNPLVPLNQATENRLTFPSLTFAEFMGFEKQIQPPATPYNGIIFPTSADFPFQPRITTQSIIVICESFELDSYDTTQSQRKSILAVVPIERNNDGNVNIAPSPLFISVKNINPIQFRNLRFRLVDGNYQPIKLFGTASMVVLIE